MHHFLGFRCKWFKTSWLSSPYIKKGRKGHKTFEYSDTNVYGSLWNVFIFSNNLALTFIRSSSLVYFFILPRSIVAFISASITFSSSALTSFWLISNSLLEKKKIHFYIKKWINIFNNFNILIICRFFSFFQTLNYLIFFLSI